MKIFNKSSIITISIVLFVLVAFGLTGPTVAFAATSPTLAGSASYSVLGATTVTNTGATTTTGAVGVATGTAITGFPPGIAGGGTHSNDASAIAAQADNLSAFGTLDQGCVTTYPGTKDLVGLNLVPGVYCADAFTLSGTLTLSGSGVWIFKSASSLITSGTANVVGGDPCNVWWRVVSSATLGTNTSLIGNILASTSIWMATGASLNGRAMAYTGEVTMDTNTISGPTCAVPVSGRRRRLEGTINVVKTVINDNGGTKVVADFSLFINGSSVVSGETNTFSATGNSYVVTETADSHYAQTFSGDCDTNGNVILNAGDDKFCIVTNDDIGEPVVIPPVPPIIDVVKVPSPLALPAGPGPVTYTYTLRNVGTVPVANITMIGDTCSPIVLASGDTNADSKLDLDETWVHTCSTTLSETHTNIVVATGWANGLSATDIASATVVVGLPIVPPLIHVTKIPSPLTLLAGGGVVTYTERVTNPGTVALSNVRLTDNTCSPMAYVSGDMNTDSKLDTTETWVYTCRTNLTKTTMNTATATGEANGLTARDLAIATVTVAAVVPKLPSTGFAPEGWNVFAVVGILMLVSTMLFLILKKRTS